MPLSITLWCSSLSPRGLSDEFPPNSFRRKPPLCPTAESSNLGDNKQLLPQCIAFLCLLSLQKPSLHLPGDPFPGLLMPPVHHHQSQRQSPTTSPTGSHDSAPGSSKSFPSGFQRCLVPTPVVTMIIQFYYPFETYFMHFCVCVFL